MLTPQGSCQFPTLGFVVDRYLKVRNFKPEQFWSIEVMHERDGIRVTFHWDRNRLFDRAAATIMLERCIIAGTATVSQVQQKPTSKWKPLPLTTVELQKLGSMFLKMDSQKVMKVLLDALCRTLALTLKIAEELYVKGWISYPRTETDQFDKDMDLRKLVEKQTQDHRWGGFAQA